MTAAAGTSPSASPEAWPGAQAAREPGPAWDPMKQTGACALELGFGRPQPQPPHSLGFHSSTGTEAEQAGLAAMGALQACHSRNTVQKSVPAAGPQQVGGWTGGSPRRKWESCGPGPSAGLRRCSHHLQPPRSQASQATWQQLLWAIIATSCLPDLLPPCGGSRKPFPSSLLGSRTIALSSSPSPAPEKPETPCETKHL